MPPPKNTGPVDYSRGFPAYPQTRTWEFDHRRLTDDQDVASTQAGSAVNAPATNSSPPAMPTLNRLPAIGSGPLAQRIVQQAQFELQTAPDSHNYYVDARVACASFVSSVLEKVGAFPSTALPTNTHQASEYRSVPAFPRLLSSAGAVPAFQSNLSLIESNVEMMSPGDIILYFSDRHQRYGHTEIYIGNGLAIGNSSSAQRITSHRVTNLRGSYGSFTAYRYSR